MRLTVETNSGGAVEIAMLASGSLMETIRDAGLPILADCGGACACATCHVYIGPEWLDRLPAMSDAEAALLEFSEGVMERSRLACQLRISAAMAGMHVELAAGAQY